MKLTRAERLPAGLELYRGLGGSMALPEAFYKGDANGCRGYTEWGFLSTTSNRATAVEVRRRTRRRFVLVSTNFDRHRFKDVSEGPFSSSCALVRFTVLIPSAIFLCTAFLVQFVGLISISFSPLPAPSLSENCTTYLIVHTVKPGINRDLFQTRL